MCDHGPQTGVWFISMIQLFENRNTEKTGFKNV